MQTALIIVALLLLILVVKREGLTPLNDVPMPKTITFKIKLPQPKSWGTHTPQHTPTTHPTHTPKPIVFSTSYVYTEDALNDVMKYYYGGGMASPGRPGELTWKFLAACNYLKLRNALNDPTAPMNIRQAWDAARNALRQSGYRWSVKFT